MKKLFIKLAKALGYEIIDQNNFVSPTLGKEINEDLSNFNDSSIVLPLGEVKITRKIKSLLIVFRTNTSVEIWDQNKKRLFEYPKIEYATRSLNSLIKSIKFLRQRLPEINILRESRKNKNLIEICSSQAEDALLRTNHYSWVKKSINSLSSFLNIETINRIEAFDISHTSGKNVSASCVVLKKDGPDKKNYRIINLGISPSVTLFNGFYNLDGYLSNHPKVYNQKFDKLQTNFSVKNQHKLRLKYEGFNDICNNCIKSDPISQLELDLNIKALLDLNGSYIFSAFQITNYEKLQLKFIKK